MRIIPSTFKVCLVLHSLSASSRKDHHNGWPATMSDFPSCFMVSLILNLDHMDYMDQHLYIYIYVYMYICIYYEYIEIHWTLHDSTIPRFLFLWATDFIVAPSHDRVLAGDNAHGFQWRWARGDLCGIDADRTAVVAPSLFDPGRPGDSSGRIRLFFFFIWQKHSKVLKILGTC